MLNRQFTAPAQENHTWVTDFTYVATQAGFVYVAFAIDLHSLERASWVAASLDGQRHQLRGGVHEMDGGIATTRRPIEPGMIHHSDAGSQSTSPLHRDRLRLPAGTTTAAPQLPRKHPTRGIRA
jgi:transposase InsO family protein